MSVENIYPIPIYYTMVKNFKNIQSEIGEAVKRTNFVRPFSEWEQSNLISDGKFDSDYIQDNGLDIFSKELDIHLNDYCDEIQSSKGVYDRQSWVTCSNKGDAIHKHTHGHTDISGVYYYKTNEKDGNLYFESPSPSGKSSFCYRNILDTPVETTPGVGKLLLFPGWLEHGVRMNNTDNQRISLSFNIFFKDRK